MTIALISIIVATIVFTLVIIIDTTRNIRWVKRVSKEVEERLNQVNKYEQNKYKSHE